MSLTLGPNYICGLVENSQLLKISLNEELENSFSRQKLKVVSNSNNNENEIILEIYKIIDSKIENGELLFLTKWKNSTEMD